MEKEHRGYVETWNEMNPLNMEKADKEIDKDLFGNMVYETTWQEEH